MGYVLKFSSMSYHMAKQAKKQAARGRRLHPALARFALMLIEEAKDNYEKHQYQKVYSRAQ